MHRHSRPVEPFNTVVQSENKKNKAVERAAAATIDQEQPLFKPHKRFMLSLSPASN